MMNFPKSFLPIAGVALILFALGCNAPPPQQLPDIESTVRARVGQAKEALTPPTTVPLPTYTLYPTFTPQPTLDLQATVEAVVEERLALVKAVSTPTPEPPDTLNLALALTPTSPPQPSRAPTELVPEPTSQAFLTYTHPAGIWKISYPSEWTGPDANFPIVVDKAEAMIFGPGYFTVWVIRDWDPDRIPNRTDKLYNYVMTELDESGRNSIENFSLKPVLVGKSPGYEARYEKGRNSYLTRWTLAESQVFKVDVSVPTERWAEEGALVKEVLTSFEPLTTGK